MANATAGAASCPANFSAAADGALRGLQETVLWPALLAEFLLAVAGNGLALHRLGTRERRPWHPGAVFSAQLAASDLLYALTLPPLVAYYYPPKRWRYGAAACRLERFLFTCNLLGSALFVAAISLHRYVGVAHPFFARGHLRPRHAWVLSAAGWALAALLAAPTLHFSGLREGTKCLAWAREDRLAAAVAYSLALATLGCFLPLLLSLAAYGALGRAVWRSPGVTATERRRVALLVAGGLAVYAGAYVPYHVTQVLNAQARRRWTEHCPSFADAKQAVAALSWGPYVGHQVARALVPLAVCLHPLLYMAVVPSLDCCPGRGAGRDTEDTGAPGQALAPADTVTLGPPSPKPAPGPGPS